MEVLLPRTDAGALVQALVVVVVWVAALLALRRSREGRLLVAGLGLMAMAWLGLRSLH